MTPTNERYVALAKIEHHLQEGYTPSEVARIWNQGNAGPCRAGVNRFGVRYDSCKYVRLVMAQIR